MNRIIASFTMSLDGFIAGPNDDVSQLFNWYFRGDTDFKLPGMDRAFRISRHSADLLTEEWSNLGALVTGRRDFDVSNAWGGKTLLNLPTFIVTHAAPAEWTGPDSPFTFVTDGVENALARAREAAGNRNVGVGGTTIVQQCLKLGLLDDLHIDLVPILLGSGIRLFDNLDGRQIELESYLVIAPRSVTHLRFKVLK
jgi:dihydrofolate reductase